MSNLTKLEFEALDITGKNYLSWVLDAEIHLDTKGLGAAIIAENEISSQDKVKAMIFLRHHLHEGLKVEYLTVKDPLELWNNLKECLTTRKQRELIRKDISIFHASDVLLQQQYCEKDFKKYAELISCMLVAEQNNELLMKNYEARPTSSAPFPEVNAAVLNKPGGGQNRGHNNTHRRGRGRNNYCYLSDNNYNSHHQKWNNNDEKEKDKGCQSNSSKDKENVCYQCGKGHWSRTCRTPKHLVNPYQDSIKEKNAETNFTYHKNNSNYDVEANFAYKNDDFKGLDDITHLDVADFFESCEERQR
ncbi:hypothetical protein CDL12_08517 [Handroanthus impetiginosus]|uniref:CCHC-type domain-containing protein n=1 Tax=Handroanthus impetiginosus TaxID=429701 RepID=A0A2G9HMQ1_9LAMI|nr:hypothetical protein CDL12_08517 [Handroanthus impetiginosus]